MTSIDVIMPLLFISGEALSAKYMYFCVPLPSGGFSVLQFSTIDLEKKLAELIMKLQRFRMEGEYKMFIDSLSERNKSKNAIKALTLVLNYHFSRKPVI